MYNNRSSRPSSTARRFQGWTTDTWRRRPFICSHRDILHSYALIYDFYVRPNPLHVLQEHVDFSTTRLSTRYGTLSRLWCLSYTPSPPSFAPSNSACIPLEHYSLGLKL